VRIRWRSRRRGAPAARQVDFHRSCSPAAVVGLMVNSPSRILTGRSIRLPTVPDRQRGDPCRPEPIDVHLQVLGHWSLTFGFVPALDTG
jgi:hypothetical protein